MRTFVNLFFMDNHLKIQRRELKGIISLIFWSQYLCNPMLKTMLNCQFDKNKTTVIFEEICDIFSKMWFVFYVLSILPNT